MVNANFTNAKLINTDLVNANLRNANVSGATFTNVKVAAPEGSRQKHAYLVSLDQLKKLGVIWEEGRQPIVIGTAR